MPLDDSQHRWLTKKEVIKASEFGHIATSGVTGGSAPATWLALGKPGLEMAVAGEVLRCCVPVFRDLDPSYAVQYRVLWTSGSSTTDDGITFIVKDDFHAIGDTLAAATSVLDTAIAEDNVTGAFDLQATEKGVRQANNISITRAQIVAGAQLVLEVEMDAVDIDLSSEKVFVLGVEVEYTPKLCDGDSVTQLFEE